MNAQTQHTPGPWHWHQRRTMQYLHDAAGHCFTQVSMPCPHVYSDESQQKRYAADARLIAAAPEMLAVLQELEESAAYWSEYDVPLGIVDRIKAACAKARGEA